MKSDRILNRKTFGLDNNIWRVMLSMIIISTGLLSYTLIDKKKCTPFSFTIKHISNSDSVFYAGEVVRFAASVNNPDLVWDFGDNSDEAEGQFVTHKFTKDGRYNVNASINGNCESLQQLTVKNTITPQAKPDNISTDNQILGRSTMMTGDEEIFTCLATADYYEWTITDHPEIKYKARTGPTTKYSFSVPGKYTIEVELDHDRKKRYSKEIIVNEVPKIKSASPEVKLLLPSDIKALIPDTKAAEKKPADNPADHPAEKQPEVTDAAKDAATHKVFKITDEQFKIFMDNVKEGQMELEKFNRYLCYGGATKAKINGKLQTFTDLYNDLNGNKKISSLNIQVSRDENCIVLITAEYKKSSGLFGIFKKK